MLWTVVKVIIHDLLVISQTSVSPGTDIRSSSGTAQRNKNGVVVTPNTHDSGVQHNCQVQRTPFHSRPDIPKP